MTRTMLLVGLTLGLFGLGCSSEQSQVLLKLRAKRVGQVNQPLTAAGAGAQNVTLRDDTNTLDISAVSLTLQDIDLERTEQSVDCDSLEDDEAAQHDDCSDSFDGPVRVNLNLGSATGGQQITLMITQGTYDEVSFDISVPDGGDPAEKDYLAKNPDLTDASVLVKGTFNGQPFTYKTDVRGDQEIPIKPALVVGPDGASGLSVAIEFDVARWFLDTDGTIIDPSTQNEAKKERIRENIGKSIESESGDD